jgi:hypothetical protein
MKIAGMKAKRNRAVALVEGGGLSADRPVAGEGPVVETAEIAGRIDMGVSPTAPPGEAKFSDRAKPM